MTQDKPERSRWFWDNLLQYYPDHDGWVRRSFDNDSTWRITTEPLGNLVAIMHALSKFTTQVQYEYNQAKADATRGKRVLEFRKAKAIGGLKDLSDRVTDKTKIAKAYQADPELEVLEKNLASAEEKVCLYDQMARYLEEHLQVYKYACKFRIAEDAKSGTP
jgi:hypothetical protein